MSMHKYTRGSADFSAFMGELLRKADAKLMRKAGRSESRFVKPLSVENRAETWAKFDVSPIAGTASFYALNSNTGDIESVHGGEFQPHHTPLIKVQFETFIASGSNIFGIQRQNDAKNTITMYAALNMADETIYLFSKQAKNKGGGFTEFSLKNSRITIDTLAEVAADQTESFINAWLAGSAPEAKRSVPQTTLAAIEAWRKFNPVTARQVTAEIERAQAKVSGAKKIAQGDYDAAMRDSQATANS